MPRKSQGSVDRSNGVLRVRVTVKDDKGEPYRPWIYLEGKFDDEKAKRIALRAAAELEGKPRARKFAGNVVSGTPLADDYFNKLWVPSREGKIKSLQDDVSRWNNHLKKLIGHKEMGAITTDDLRGVVEALDAKAADPTKRFGKKSAINCWTVVASMFDDACSSKIAALRILKTNPAAGIQPPDTPEEVEKQWLFPVELQKLLACPQIPIGRRRLYAAAVYCYTRPGEVLGLLWRLGLDLEHGMVRVYRAWDSRKEVFNEYTKTGDSRHFRIEPVLLPMFQAMWKRRRTELVFETADKLAETLRADLLTAGVDRPALHRPRAGAELMRFHDLRATGITYMAMRGDRDQEIRERAGHRDFGTTLLYIRRGHQALGSSIGVPFDPLPAELCGIVPETSPPNGGNGSSGGNRSGIVEREKGFEPSTQASQSSGGTATGAKSAKAGVASDHADDSGERWGRFGDDSFGAQLLAENANRGRRLAAFTEVDQDAAAPGLAFCRGVEAAYRGDEAATLAALSDAYHALELDTTEGRERLAAAVGEAG
jgi:integrase